jgi:hypothetical protein
LFQFRAFTRSKPKPQNHDLTTKQISRLPRKGNPPCLAQRRTVVLQKLMSIWHTFNSARQYRFFARLPKLNPPFTRNSYAQKTLHGETINT